MTEENIGQNYAQPLPSEAESIKSLVKIAGLIALIFGIINLIWGIPGLLVLVGIIGIIFGIIDIITWMQCKKINELIDQGKYKEAKDKTLVWMIVSIILGGFIPGIILLVAYLKYDGLNRVASQQNVPPPPPQ